MEMALNIMCTSAIYRTRTNRNSLNYLASGFCSVTPTSISAEWNKLKSNFSKKQQSAILQKLNEYGPDILRKHFSEENAQALEIHLSEIGSYKSLDEVASVEGINVSKFNTFGTSIIQSIKDAKISAKKLNIVSPKIDAEKQKNINTILGFRVKMNFISWALLDRNCNVLQWEGVDITDLPYNATTIETVEKALQISRQIPDANAYVLEKDSGKPMKTMNNLQFRMILRQQQLYSIIISMLLTRNNVFNELEGCNSFNNMYLIRANAPANLFNLHIGSETVTTENVIDKLLETNTVGLENVNEIHFSPEAKNAFRTADIFQKEELGMSLLLSIAFLNLLASCR